MRWLHWRRRPEAAEPASAAVDDDAPPIVVPMRVEDLDAILVIERASFPTPWSRRAFLSELTENAYARYYVAKVGGRVIGYAGTWAVLDEVHITNVAVHPSWRHQGIGRQLMEAIVTRADENRCRRVTLEVRRSNLVAQRLYESFGFVRRGVREGYYTDTHEDAFVMVRERSFPQPGGLDP